MATPRVSVTASGDGSVSIPASTVCLLVNDAASFGVSERGLWHFGNLYARLPRRIGREKDGITIVEATADVPTSQARAYSTSASLSSSSSDTVRVSADALPPRVHMVLTPSTCTLYMYTSYRIVISVDMSASMFSLDAHASRIAYADVLPILSTYLRSLVHTRDCDKGHVHTPDLLLSIVAHAHTRARPRVLVHGYTLTLGSVEPLLHALPHTLRELEAECAAARGSGASHASLTPLLETSVSLLKLLPSYASAVITLISDCVCAPPACTSYGSLTHTLRVHDVAINVLAVGTCSGVHTSLARVPDAEGTAYMCVSTSGLRMKAKELEGKLHVTGACSDGVTTRCGWTQFQCDTFLRVSALTHAHGAASAVESGGVSGHPSKKENDRAPHKTSVYMLAEYVLSAPVHNDATGVAAAVHTIGRGGGRTDAMVHTHGHSHSHADYAFPWSGPPPFQPFQRLCVCVYACRADVKRLLEVRLREGFHILTHSPTQTQLMLAWQLQVVIVYSIESASQSGAGGGGAGTHAGARSHAGDTASVHTHPTHTHTHTPSVAPLVESCIVVHPRVRVRISVCARRDFIALMCACVRTHPHMYTPLRGCTLTHAQGQGTTPAGGFAAPFRVAPSAPARDTTAAPIPAAASPPSTVYERMSVGAIERSRVGACMQFIACVQQCDAVLAHMCNHAHGTSQTRPHVHTYGVTLEEALPAARSVRSSVPSFRGLPGDDTAAKCEQLQLELLPLAGLTHTALHRWFHIDTFELVLEPWIACTDACDCILAGVRSCVFTHAVAAVRAWAHTELPFTQDVYALAHPHTRTHTHTSTRGKVQPLRSGASISGARLCGDGETVESRVFLRMLTDDGAAHQRAGRTASAAPRGGVTHSYALVRVHAHTHARVHAARAGASDIVTSHVTVHASYFNCAPHVRGGHTRALMDACEGELHVPPMLAGSSLHSSPRLHGRSLSASSFSQPSSPQHPSSPVRTMMHHGARVCVTAGPIARMSAEPVAAPITHVHRDATVIDSFAETPANAGAPPTVEEANGDSLDPSSGVCGSTRIPTHVLTSFAWTRVYTYTIKQASGGSESELLRAVRAVVDDMVVGRLGNATCTGVARRCTCPDGHTHHASRWTCIASHARDGSVLHARFATMFRVAGPTRERGRTHAHGRVCTCAYAHTEQLCVCTHYVDVSSNDAGGVRIRVCFNMEPQDGVVAVATRTGWRVITTREVYAGMCAALYSSDLRAIARGVGAVAPDATVHAHVHDACNHSHTRVPFLWNNETGAWLGTAEVTCDGGHVHMLPRVTLPTHGDTFIPTPARARLHTNTHAHGQVHASSSWEVLAATLLDEYTAAGGMSLAPSPLRPVLERSEAAAVESGSHVLLQHAGVDTATDAEVAAMGQDEAQRIVAEALAAAASSEAITES